MTTPDSNEDDLIRGLLEQADAEAQPRAISPFATEWGCCLGCLMGPALVIALLLLDAFLRPDAPAGGPASLLIVLVVAAGVGALAGSQLLPSLLRRRHRRR